MIKTAYRAMAFAAVVLLAGCQSSSVTPAQKQAMQQMTPQQRDQVGRQAAQRLRQNQIKENADLRVRDVRYRASDDTLVLDLQLKNFRDAGKMNAQQRRDMENKVVREMRKRTCADADMKSVMVHGRYALEYRILLNTGKALMKPVRVTAAHC
ncbi:hypothetical protein L1281_000693 [Neisseria sp. HSC-16F19]|nr:hypothetical protein [Neisseria sp. HSC-16F19]MCP2040113.1 hypothetical protein [Neisseria sp. HSC-16F19]